jgi:acetyl/propionyl-CoA carboxylase alpha subunit
MQIKKLLIANRGEIAIRIARAAAELGLATVAIHPEDDAGSLHTRMADEARLLPGTGVGAYLDMGSVLAAALASGCDAIHPGYGFLSEQPAFARLCEGQNVLLVGPGANTLELLGDKGRALGLARQCDVPVLPGTDSPATMEQVATFRRQSDGAIVIKAVAGGGGRGMRIVEPGDDLRKAWQQCAAEAEGRVRHAQRFTPSA